MNIPVVVATYDRVSSLKRLLSSLVQAHYSDPVTLIVSVDGGGAPEVQKYAEEFQWPHGEKEIVIHDANLGLRQHILSCGDLARNYDGIILLEDDLYVSPWFYDYAIRAAEFYHNCRDISGIALYGTRFNESARLPFYPLDDGHDVFFMQLACSWGQLWLRHQWEDFTRWYGENKDVDCANDYTLPCEIRTWPESSWKKYFIRYMVEQDKFFVYPRTSFTTNFGDVGQHHLGTNLYQVPLQYGERSSYRFADFKQSPVKYDSFGEMLPESIARLCPHLGMNGDDLDVDLYGIKEQKCFTGQYVLTAKACSQHIASFGRSLKPLEHNIINEIPGEDLFLAAVDQIKPLDVVNFQHYIYKRAATVDEQKYFYNITDLHYYLFKQELKGNKDKLFHEQQKKEELAGELEKARIKLAACNKSIEAVKQSFSYRIGNAIILPFSSIKKILNKN